MLGPRLANPDKDPVHQIPHLTGSAGKAWKVRHAEALASAGIDPADDATLGHWLVEARWAHPAWHSYSIVLVHLRPMPDGRPTKLYLDDATHEVWLYALDPDGSRQKLIDGAIPGVDGAAGWLTPKNIAGQFIAEDDAAATARVEAAIQRVCDGTLSPDTDYIRHWAHLFGGHMLKPGAGDTRIVVNPDGPDAVELVIPAHPGPQDLN